MPSKKFSTKSSPLLSGCFFAVSIVAHTTIAIAHTPENTPPETAFAAAATDLLNLQKKIKGAHELWNQRTLAPKKIAAEEALDRARNFYEGAEYLSAIREINAFQDLSQYHHTRPFLDAMFYLGNSYDMLGFETQAIKSFLRYLAAFTASPQPDYNELMTIMTSLMNLAGRQSQTSRTEMARIISAVTTLDLPKELRPQLLYSASRTARDSGRADLARSWMDQTNLASLTGDVGAKIAYFRGALLLAQGDEEQAETSLLTAKDMAETTDTAASDLAVLALARIEASRRNHPKALRYYQGIKADRPAHRTALYETIFLALRVNRDGIAESSARQFLSKYPEGGDTLQVKTTLAYILMRAGKKGEATDRLGDSDKTLNQIMNSIRLSMRGKLRVTHGELIGLFDSAAMVLRQSPLAEEGLKVFAKLAELQRRVADAEGDLRSLIYTMGRSDFGELMPRYELRVQQLKILTTELLTIGHKLLASERQSLEKSLTPAQLAQLTASERRRTKMLDPGPSASRNADDWAVFANIIGLQSKIVSSSAALGTARVQLASARYLDFRRGSPNEAETRSFAIQTDDEKRINTQMMSALERLRSFSIQSLASRGPDQPLKRLLTQYASALYQEEAVLALWREKNDVGFQLLNSQDASRAWSLWRVGAKELYSSISELSSIIGGDVTKVIKTHAEINAASATIKSQIDSTTRRLELAMGQAISTLLEHYESEYLARSSQNQKLRADLEWSRLDDLSEESDLQNQEFDKRKQEIRDTIQDTKQGVTSP